MLSLVLNKFTNILSLCINYLETVQASISAVSLDTSLLQDSLDTLEKRMTDLVASA